jgi:predicted PurR-regulated permease PerM
MEKKKISRYLKSTKDNFKKFKDLLVQIKKEREKPVEIFDHKKDKEEKVKEEIIISFSLASVAKATLVVIGIVVLSQFLADTGRILLIFFIAILFSSALNPTAEHFEKKYRVPRALSVILMFVALLFVLGFFISQLIPLVASQLIELAKGFSSLVSKFGDGSINLPFGEKFQPFIQSIGEQINKDVVITQVKHALESLSSELQVFAGDTIGVIKNVFDGVLNFVIVLVLTFFLVINENAVNKFFISLFPSRHGGYIAKKIEAIQEKIGYWLRGQMVLMLLMFTLSLTGLLILGIDNAFTLAMMTGIAELIPVVGPICAGIPAILIAFNESPWLAIWVLGLIILIQQIEGHILIPIVMRRAVGLNPIIIILAMLTGLETLGIVGMIMAVPVATTLSIFVTEYAEKKK